MCPYGEREAGACGSGRLLRICVGCVLTRVPGLEGSVCCPLPTWHGVGCEDLLITSHASCAMALPPPCERGATACWGLGVRWESAPWRGTKHALRTWWPVAALSCGTARTPTCWALRTAVCSAAGVFAAAPAPRRAPRCMWRAACVRCGVGGAVCRGVRVREEERGEGEARRGSPSGGEERAGHTHVRRGDIGHHHDPQQQQPHQRHRRGVLTYLCSMQQLARSRNPKPPETCSRPH